LSQFDVWKKIPGAVDEFRRHGGSAICKYLKAAQIILFTFRKLCQQVDHRRHKDRVIDPLPLDERAEVGWREARKRDLTCADRRRREYSGKIGDVENRRGMKIDASFPVSKCRLRTNRAKRWRPVDAAS
jgi:hypothetical protein